MQVSAWLADWDRVGRKGSIHALELHLHSAWLPVLLAPRADADAGRRGPRSLLPGRSAPVAESQNVDARIDGQLHQCINRKS